MGMFTAWWYFVTLGEDADGGLVRASLRGRASPGTGTSCVVRHLALCPRGQGDLQGRAQ